MLPRAFGLAFALFTCAAVLVAQASPGDTKKPQKDASKDAIKDAPKDKKPTDPAKGSNFYPVEKGNRWTFKVTANGNESTVTTEIGKVEKIDGVMLSRLETGGGAVTEHLSQTSKGVYRHRLNGAEIEPPFQLLPYPAKVGAKWKGKFTVQGATHDYTGAVEAEEMIAVPAGKYKTLRIKIALEENGQPVETVYWFAHDVGFVKQTVTVGGMEVVQLELQKFEPGKRAEKVIGKQVEKK
jgi:hypothetical protein